MGNGNFDQQEKGSLLAMNCWILNSCHLSTSIVLYVYVYMSYVYVYVYEKQSARLEGEKQRNKHYEYCLLYTVLSIVGVAIEIYSGCDFVQDKDSESTYFPIEISAFCLSVFICMYVYIYVREEMHKVQSLWFMSTSTFFRVQLALCFAPKVLNPFTLL
jgi:Ca2+/Na+ antiporter